MHTATKALPGSQTPDPSKRRHSSDAEAHARSAERVAAGRQPLIRTEAPGMFGRLSPDESSIVALVHLVSGKALTMTTLGGAGARESTSTQVAEQVASYPGPVMFADRASLSATVRALNRSKDGSVRRTASVIGYIARLPMMRKFSVLTNGLAAKYWAPSDPHSLPSWVQAFNTGNQPDVDAILSLVQFASIGSSPNVPEALGSLVSSASQIHSSLAKGRSGAISAYKAINGHMEIWSAVERTDVHLRESYLRSGDTVQVTPFKTLGGIIECHVTTPFKLRPGSSVLIFNDDDPGREALLLDLNFDAEAQSLTARFKSTGSAQAGARSRKKRLDGYDILADPGNRGVTYWATMAPFNKRSSGSSGSSWAGPGSWKSGNKVARELPLYVSLAAAAASGAAAAGSAASPTHGSAA